MDNPSRTHGGLVSPFHFHSGMGQVEEVKRARHEEREFRVGSRQHFVSSHKVDEIRERYILDTPVQIKQLWCDHQAVMISDDVVEQFVIIPYYAD